MHELEEHYGESRTEPVWRKIDSLEDLAKIEEAEINAKQLKKYQNIMTCNHCSLSSDYNRSRYYITPEEQMHHIIHR